MRKYSPPPKFDRHGHCGCEQGTLYVSNQYFLPLYLCSSCGFAGHDTEKRTIDTEGGYPERKMHLNLIERMWAWLGVRAPKAVGAMGRVINICYERCGGCREAMARRKGDRKEMVKLTLKKVIYYEKE